MIYRRLSNDGDYLIGAGSSGFVSGIEAVTQAIITRIKLLRDEWWENLLEGTPLWQQILGHKSDEEAIRIINNVLVNRVLETKGVSSVESYSGEFNPSTRKYTFSAVVNTVYGRSNIEEVL